VVDFRPENHNRAVEFFIGNQAAIHIVCLLLSLLLGLLPLE